jgi:hypothetical protein
VSHPAWEVPVRRGHTDLHPDYKWLKSNSS